MSKEASWPVFIVGTTASGKSKASMEIAKEFPRAEILSLDKSAAWCEMDIGTTKPSSTERKQVTHQLIDIFHMDTVDNRPSNVVALNNDQGEYPLDITAIMSREAGTHLDRLGSEGNVVLCVGGSAALYASLYDGIESPRISDKLMKELSALFSLPVKLQQLYLTLNNIPLSFIGDDPIALAEHMIETAIQISPSNRDHAQGIAIGIDVDVDSETLYGRIVNRTEEMIQNGLVGEVTGLVEQYGWRAPLSTTIGYREFQGRIQRKGKVPKLNDVIQDINVSTVRYAWRQRAWLNRREEIIWVSSPQEATDLAIENLRM